MILPAENGISFAESDCGVIISWEAQNIRFEHSFVRGELARRAKQSNQGILKACSNKKRTIHSVLDLTAGWGLDGLILASHGKQVTLVEKNAAVAAVIRQSLTMLGRSQGTGKTFGNLSLIQGNALDYLSGLDRGAFDCIYLDPMFPEHKSAAKPSKSLQLLQQLTDNESIEPCFEQALQIAGNRVVVKRPLKAANLTGSLPDLVVREKTIRFDVYLTGLADS